MDPCRHRSARSKADRVAGSYEDFRLCSMLSKVDVDSPDSDDN